MEEIQLALIGGSGFDHPEMFDGTSEHTVATPYGNAQVIIGRIGERQIAFLARHGKGHALLPHQLNYRANIWGLKSLGVKRIIATTAVGSMRLQFEPGSLVIVDQFIDFTKQRPLTFFDQGDVHRAHIDVSRPYCSELGAVLLRCAQGASLAVHNGGCYVCAEGPRYETTAEIKAYQMLGGDVVGMTGIPEVVLARELGICYANISIITNWAAGISPTVLAHCDVVAMMDQNQAALRQFVRQCLSSIAPSKINCCHS